MVHSAHIGIVIDEGRVEELGASIPMEGSSQSGRQVWDET